VDLGIDDRHWDVPPHHTIMMFDSSDEQWRQLDEWDQRVAEVAA
jgi:hypothetical protein